MFTIIGFYTKSPKSLQLTFGALFIVYEWFMYFYLYKYRLIDFFGVFWNSSFINSMCDSFWYAG